MILTTTNPRTTEVSKMLLNAWSAEFALRIKPVCANRSYLNSSLSWIFPQAYFAVLFSARAVLAVDEVNLANPEVIEKLLRQWAQNGKYGKISLDESNPFVELMQYRLKGDLPARRMSGPEAAALHVRLTEKVHAVSLIHETYILNRLGSDAYGQLIEQLPDYLKNGFVGARTTFLLNVD
jgi:hypothetical protein